MKYQYIIWDWNGTVVDDVSVAWNAVNEMLQEWNHPLISMTEYRRAMDTPIIRFYEHFFDMEQTSFAWIADRFHQYYHDHKEEIFLHDGVREKLEQFRKAGCHQIVLSSSSKEMIVRDAQFYGVDSIFDDILGADNLLAGSKVERAVQYFREHSIPLEQTVLIGDAVHDYEVAAELGVACVLMACGHQDRKSLFACGCPVYDGIRDWKGCGGN